MSPPSGLDGHQAALGVVPRPGAQTDEGLGLEEDPLATEVEPGPVLESAELLHLGGDGGVPPVDRHRAPAARMSGIVARPPPFKCEVGAAPVGGAQRPGVGEIPQHAGGRSGIGLGIAVPEWIGRIRIEARLR